MDMNGAQIHYHDQSPSCNVHILQWRMTSNTFETNTVVLWALIICSNPCYPLCLTHLFLLRLFLPFFLRRRVRIRLLFGMFTLYVHEYNEMLTGEMHTLFFPIVALPLPFTFLSFSGCFPVHFRCTTNFFFIRALLLERLSSATWALFTSSASSDAFRTWWKLLVWGSVLNL